MSSNLRRSHSVYNTHDCDAKYVVIREKRRRQNSRGGAIRSQAKGETDMDILRSEVKITRPRKSIA